MSSDPLASTSMILQGAYARLEQALRETGITQKQLATELGIDAATVSRAMNGVDTLARHWLTVSDVLKRKGIAVDWLLHGEGAMRTGSDSQQHRAVKEDPPTIPMQAVKVEAGIVTSDSVLRAAPPGRFRATPGKRMVQVLEDAMEPVIQSGQWVLILPEEDRKAVDGDLVLFQTNGARAYVRRLRIEEATDGSGNVYILEAENRNRRPLLFAKEDRRMVCVVVGVVFE